MQTLLIQNGNGEAAEMLRLSNAHHSAYAQRHGMTFLTGFVNIEHGRHAMWDKIWILNEYLAAHPDGTLLLWLDADTLIMQPSIDIRAAIPEGFDLAMFRATRKGWDMFNAGVMFIRNSEEVRKFYADVWERGDVVGPLAKFCDEPRINERLDANAYTLKVHRMDARFNMFLPYVIDDPIIKAWHGCPRESVRRRIADELYRMDAAS